MENLRENPKFAKFFNLLSQFEQEGVDDTGLKKLINLSSPFYKEEKLTELLNIYKILESYFPYSKILADQISKLQELITKTEKNLSLNWIKSKIKEAKNNYRQKNYRQAILICKEILNYDRFNINAQIISQKARHKIMKIELNKHENEVKKQGINQLVKFYESLYCLTPESYLIRKKLKKAQQIAEKEEINKKKQIIDSGINSLQNDLLQNKLLEAIKGAEEILQIDKNNIKAKVLLEKAKKQDEKAMEKQLLIQMISEFKKLKDFYKIQKSKFIKI